MLENLALRHQLEALTRNRSRPGLRPADRLLWGWLSRLWSQWRSHIAIVQPETVVRWHCSASRRYRLWRSGGGRRPARPRIERELQALVRRMTRENPRWGHLRVLRELRQLGFQISLQTVRRYRGEVPRPSSQSWRTSLSNHGPQLWASNFLTVQTVTFRTLYGFFIIAHERRPLLHLNVTVHPSARWIWRQLTDATPGGSGPRFVIRDRDRADGRAFVERAKRIGIQSILTPIAALQANAIAERVVGTLRRECLDHLIVVNVRHLRLVLEEFARKYNQARAHRALALEVPRAEYGREQAPDASRVGSRDILGGLIHEYELAAA